MQEVISAIANISTAVLMLIALGTLIATVYQYNQNQIQQKAARNKEQIQREAAQTREDLQAIIGDCNQFLRPLSQDIPYPVLHTVTAIIQQFCKRIYKFPLEERVKAVEALLKNKDLLLSICVEGWIKSSQVLHMIDMAEKLEHKAFSHNLQGKLLFISHTSFLLAGIVGEICSPITFYNMLTLKRDEILHELDERRSSKDETMDTLDIVAVLLQSMYARNLLPPTKMLLNKAFTLSRQRPVSSSTWRMKS